MTFFYKQLIIERLKLNDFSKIIVFPGMYSGIETHMMPPIRRQRLKFCVFCKLSFILWGGRQSCWPPSVLVMSSKLKTDGDAFYLSRTPLNHGMRAFVFSKKVTGSHIRSTIRLSSLFIGSFEGPVAFVIEIAGNKGSLGGRTIVRLRSLLPLFEFIGINKLERSKRYSDGNSMQAETERV